MSSKTRIVVLHMKEIIYTAAFVGLGLLLIILFMIMFHPKKSAVSTDSEQVSYIPGVYTEMVSLGGQDINVEVCVDEAHITALTLSSLDESVETMYPLVRPAFDSLSEQICRYQSTEGVTCSDDMKYTSLYLMDAIKAALDKAKK